MGLKVIEKFCEELRVEDIEIVSRLIADFLRFFLNLKKVFRFKKILIKQSLTHKKLTFAHYSRNYELTGFPVE